jgi:hypothetical protein
VWLAGGLPQHGLIFTAFLSKAIDESLPAFQYSVPGAHRLRLQADVLVKF